MPDPSPQCRPAAPAESPSPPDWRGDIALEAARLVAECRAEMAYPPGIDAPIRRRVLDVAWDVYYGRWTLPDSSAATGAILDGRFYLRPPAERFRLILASHAADWPDGRTRLAFLAEVVRGIEAALGEGPKPETPTAHPGE